jgi:plastocyanin
MAATLAVAWAANAGPAVGDTLYVKVRNTQVKKAANVSSATVTVLQPGDTVTWQGSDGNGWHKVKAGTASGHVYQSNIQPTKLADEVASSGKVLDAQAFASSGAAGKTVGEGAKLYAKKEGKNYGPAVMDVQVDEAVAVQTTDAAVAAHVKDVGLHPVVEIAEAKR